MKTSVYTSPDSLCKWIFEYADFGIILTDAELRVIDVNLWIENQLGKQKIHIKDKSIFHTFPEIIERGLDHYLTDALGGASVVLSSRFHSHLISLPFKTGNESSLMRQNVKITPILNKARITGLLIYIEDVTERLNREDLLQKKNEELQKLNSTKDRFFNIISHDLRSPFTALIGLSELLMDDRSITPEQSKNIISMLHLSLKNEYNLLENLLKWSQLQSGRFELEFRDVILCEIVKNILNIAAPAIRSKNITVKTKEIDPNLIVHTDNQALTTILHNLIFNAVKFTSSGGNIEISAFKSSEKVIISVRDNGVGIPEDMIERIFSPDELVTTPGTNKEKGSGLGLILVKELIEKINGDVWVKSAPGTGSTFFISFPVKANK
jgi:signal transduction histidine kinase